MRRQPPELPDIILKAIKMKKIPFDIKYRPEIESGKYKVQTTTGRDVRIVCWDKRAGEREQIVALVTNEQGDQETCMLYSPNGILISTSQNEKFKLVILTDEPELTEFEEGLVDFFNKRNMILPDKDGVYNKHDCEELLHESSKELLDLAKAELLSRHDESNPAIEAIANLEREIANGKYPKWLSDMLDEAYKDGRKAMAYEYHGPSIPTWYPPCFYGGPCTNPQLDCINCPLRQSGANQISTNTSNTSEQ